MLYPILLKRIMSRIKYALEELLFRDNVLHREKYEEWIKQYLELSDTDKQNLITKFKRAQTSAIMYAMAKQDREIFVNQLGCFYIKPTTIDFYNALNKLTEGKEKSDYDFEEVKQSALEETRKLYIERANRKKNAKNISEIRFKV